jgi:hypothetical protein
VVAGLGGGDRDLVQAAVALVGLVLVSGRRPAAVGQGGELVAQPGLGVVHHPLHHGLDRVRAVLVDERVQPLAADVIGPDLGAQVKPDEQRDARAAHPQVGHVALELPVADDLDRRGGQRLGEHILGGGRERPEPDPAQVRLVGDRAGPREQLAVVEDRLVDDHVVLVQAAADPRVVAQEHVALGDAGIGGPVPQGPVDGQVDRADEHGVVEADLDFLAELVADGEVEVVGVGDDRRAGHPLERLAHLVGDRPQPVPDHFIGERVELVDLFRPNGMGLQPRRKRSAQFLRVDRPAGEDLRSGDEHGHDALLACLGRADGQVAERVHGAVVPPGMTTVVVGTSTIAGPVSRCPARSCR